MPRLPLGTLMPRRVATRWWLLVVMVPLLGVVLRAFAAPAPRPVENPHGEFKEDCALCHRPEAWLPARISRRFDHARYGFALEGAHAAARCTACHATLEFKQHAMNCTGCHEDPHRGEMGRECARCHSARSFVDQSAMRRLHQTTRFPLTGGHAGLDCESCHKPAAAGQMQFVGTRATCVDCHLADYRAAKDPDHSAGFSTDCVQCHTPLGWHAAHFDHAASGFPLTGAHLTAACAGCHVNGRFKGTPRDCASCHAANYAATTDPRHTLPSFPTTCQNCHGTTSWAGATFDHSTTAFPLTGAHKAVACSGCHGDGVYAGKSTLCVSCHQTDYNGTTDPRHTLPSYPTTCQSCHGTTSWAGAAFDHSTTAFPLTGAHKTVACTGCHGDGVYAGKSMLCVSCHQTDYNGTTDPKHSLPAFPTTCQSCHSTTSWAGASFDHSLTAFPLTGAHQAVACANCHGDGVYAGKSMLCVSCHQTDYNGTTDPKHTLPSFPTTCQNCHGTTSWAGATFDHSTTAFPLTGAHRAVACTGCHGDGVYAGKSTLCVSCHQTDYNGTTDPKHTLPSFSTTCQSCHSTTSWAGASFDHSTTAFPLTGAHQTVACAGCHGDGVYAGKSTLCYSCHATDYNGTTDPKHTLPSYPTTCESCHSTASWAGAVFDHSKTAFPLTGAHQAVACAGCHADGVYAGKSTLCSSCHMTDYTTAADPNHPGAHLATTCADCHTTTSWAGATVNHDTPYFRIYSGTHRGRWTLCADCHNVASDYAQFNCLGCHPHDNKTQTDNEHSGRSGYSYTSTACYSCHRNT